LESLKLIRTGHWNIMGEEIYGLGSMLYIDIEENEDIFGHDGSSTPPINSYKKIRLPDGIIVLKQKDLATK
jgi:hypothetical protein